MRSPVVDCFDLREKQGNKMLRYTDFMRPTSRSHVRVFKKKSKYNKYDSGIILKKHCSGSINHWVFFFDKYFILSLIHGHTKKKKNVVFNDTENVLCKVLL